MNKTPCQTYLKFASEKLRALKSLINFASVTTSDNSVNFIALEEFKRTIPYSVMLHITEKNENNLLKAAQVADLFSLVHRPVFPGEGKLHPHVKSGGSA